MLICLCKSLRIKNIFYFSQIKLAIITQSVKLQLTKNVIVSDKASEEMLYNLLIISIYNK